MVCRKFYIREISFNFDIIIIIYLRRVVKIREFFKTIS